MLASDCYTVQSTTMVVKYINVHVLDIIDSRSKSSNQKFDVYMRSIFIGKLRLLWKLKRRIHIVRKTSDWRLSYYGRYLIFPHIYAMLSGWSTYGKHACPYCMHSILSFYLKHYKKCCFFDGHLPIDHQYCRQKSKFSGRIEKDIGIERIIRFELKK